MTPSNEYYLRARPIVDRMTEVDLLLGNGIGLIESCIFEPHFSEWGGFPRLVQSMELSESAFCFGIDEFACIEIQNDSNASVSGLGRVYYLYRTGPLDFNVKILDPEESIVIKQYSQDSMDL